jgi:molecular chaperone HscB
MKNYYNFYNLPIKYYINKNELRKAYLKKSRALHPDINFHHSDLQQNDSLTESMYNNEAYQTLMDDNKRLDYIFILFGFTDSDDINKKNLTKTFLNEVLEFNISLEDAIESNEQDTQLIELYTELCNWLSKKEKDIQVYLNKFDAEDDIDKQQKILEEAYNHFLERKYLLRIKENMPNFAN